MWFLDRKPYFWRVFKTESQKCVYSCHAWAHEWWRVGESNWCSNLMTHVSQFHGIAPSKMTLQNPPENWFPPDSFGASFLAAPLLSFLTLLLASWLIFTQLKHNLWSNLESRTKTHSCAKYSQVWKVMPHASRKKCLHSRRGHQFWTI